MPKRTRARVYRGTKRNLAFLAARLRAGELVAVPTETVYGLAANAYDASACRQIFRAKGRPTTDPLIVHVHHWSQVEEICHPNDAARRLARAFWPGPLTLVLPKKPIVHPIVTAGRDSVAVRMPAHPLFRRLLRVTGAPLAAPSANPFGYVSPTSVEHVLQGLGAKISYVLDGGAAGIGLESTIVDLRDPAKPAVLRPGYVTAEEIKRALRQRISTPRRSVPRATEHLVVRDESAGKCGEGALAPGMLARHYSPRTPVRLHRALQLPAKGEGRHGYLFLRKPDSAVRGEWRAGAERNVYWLDPRGDLRGAARRLFAILREMDAGGFDVIHAELAGGKGLADAINDRLRRAAAR